MPFKTVFDHVENMACFPLVDKTEIILFLDSDPENVYPLRTDLYAIFNCRERFLAISDIMRLLQGM